MAKGNFSQLWKLQRARQKQALARRAKGTAARPRMGWRGLRDADELAGTDSRLVLYGMVPMGLAVVAGLWMAFRG